MVVTTTTLPCHNVDLTVCGFEDKVDLSCHAVLKPQLTAHEHLPSGRQDVLVSGRPSDRKDLRSVT